MLRVLSIIGIIVILGVGGMLALGKVLSDRGLGEGLSAEGGAQGPSPVLRAQRALVADGYYSGQPDDDWSEGALIGLEIYLADWGVPPPAGLNEDYVPDEDMLARLERRHPATAPGFVALANVDDCTVWDPRPMAREAISWSGACAEGRAHGGGKLEALYRHRGAEVADHYVGAMAEGRPEGEGSWVSAFGPRYEGAFRAGRFDGRGTYRDIDGSTYIGAFRDGLPNGRGELVNWDGQVFSGRWEAGCLTSLTKAAWFLTTPEACGIGGGFTVMDMFRQGGVRQGG